jgi:hypothetical protein
MAHGCQSCLEYAFVSLCKGCMQMSISSDHMLAMSLLSPRAVRERTQDVYKAALRGELEHFAVYPGRLPDTADYVIDTIRQNYPSLDIPFHARWRHFTADGRNLWADIDAAAHWAGPLARGRAAYDLAIVSVLLDAGAGAAWRYDDAPTGLTFARSEGLGIASLRMFEAGAFSSDPAQPFRADASRLAEITAEDIAAGFQVTAENPLLGLEGRAALLRRLGETTLANAAVFAAKDTARPGGMFDYLCAHGSGGHLPAATILQALLLHLGPIWPSRILLGDLPLGDCWKHSAVKRSDATDGLVPFHKLSQWMAYSLIEPLQWAGLEVRDIDGLTGLPEYRNGGLFIDTDVITLRHDADTAIPHDPGSPLVVEWRALTVALLDDTARLVRDKLGFDAVRLPLAKVLEGGTWSAGRRIAREKRDGGPPPLSIISDGTVF